MRKFAIFCVAAALCACSPPAETNNENNDATNNASTNQNPNSATNGTPNSSTNGTPNSSTNNANNSSNLTDVRPDISQFAAAFCAFDASCAAGSYDSTEECETDVEETFFGDEECYRYDTAEFDECVRQLGQTCVGDYENYPAACDTFVDLSVCCAEDGGVYVDDECRDACMVPDDCGFGFDCTMGACDCPNTLVQVNDVLMCLEECEGDTCDTGQTCRSGVCVPD